MNDFLLVFRRPAAGNEPAPSPEQIQAMMKLWQDWIANLATKGNLVDSGNRLTPEGRVVKPGNVVTNGPYVELKETLGGYIIIRASSFDEAAALCQGCPAFKMGGNVEIRMPVPMN